MSSSNPLVLERLRRLDRSSQTFDDGLADVLRDNEYERWASNLRGEDLAWLIDYLDKALHILNPSGSSFLECLRELRRICGTTILLPASYTLPPSLLNVDPQPVASGGPGDVYAGTLNGSRVCVKRVRVYSKDGKDKAMQVYQGAVVWKHVKHKNVLPLLGITSTPLQLISEWMFGGDLREYIGEHPDKDRLGLLHDITDGLHYLHSCNVIHGDLKGSNILVDSAGHARITDLTLASITTDTNLAPRAPEDRSHSARWTAPEILNEEGTCSKKADVFSFAMVMIEVFTGLIPFNKSPPITAMLAVMAGKRPQRPTHPTFTEELWVLTHRCWDQDPHLRPEISEVWKILCASEPSSIKPSNNNHKSTSELTEQLKTPTEDGPPWGLPTAKMGPLNAVLQKLMTSGLHPEGVIEPDPLSLPVPLNDLYFDRFIFDGLNNTLHEGFVNELMDLPEVELTQAVEQLSNILTCLDPAGELSRKCLYALRKLCGSRRILPPDFELSKVLLPPDKPPKAQGGFCDAYEGSIGIKVCIKRLRISPMESQQGKMKELFYKEAIVWKHLVHPNIVPFKGITFSPLQLVSEWMPNGEIRHYARTKPKADLVALLLGVANGLAYLHSRGVIHGDLKGSNIMIDESGDARITDFGLTTIDPGPLAIPDDEDSQGVSLRWTAPEILEHGGPATMKSDVYSFGIVVIEVFTGEVPFKATKSSEVVMRILNGERPKRPSHPKFTDNLWELTRRCWVGHPKDRPKMKGVVKALTTGGLPDILPATPRAIGSSRSSLTLASPGSSAGDDDNAGSDLSPPAPPKVGKDGHPTCAVTDKNTTTSSPGRPSGPDANDGSKKGPTAQGPSSHLGDYNNVSHVPRSLDQANVEKTYSTLALPQNVNPEHVTGPNIFPSRFVRWPVDWFRKITAVHPPARMQDHGSQGLTSRFPVVGYDPARVSIPMDYRHPRSTDRSTPENCSQTARLNTLPSLPPSTPPLIIYEQPDAPTPKKRITLCCLEIYVVRRSPKKVNASVGDPRNPDGPIPEYRGRMVGSTSIPPKKKRGIWHQLRGYRGSRSPELHSLDRHQLTQTHGQETGGPVLGSQLPKSIPLTEQYPLNFFQSRPHQPDASLSRDDRGKLEPASSSTGVDLGSGRWNAHCHELPTGRSQPLILPYSLSEDEEPRISLVHQGTRALCLQMNGTHEDGQERADWGTPEDNIPGEDVPEGSVLEEGVLEEGIPAWKQLINHTPSMDERISLVSAVFSDYNEIKVVRSLSADNAQTFVDMIYEVLDSPNLPQRIRKRCTRSLYRICGHQILVPRSMLIPLCYDPSETPCGHGGFADVWKGNYNHQVVAAKALRVYLKSDLKRVKRRFCKEVMMWKTLRHPNVLPLIGVTMTEFRLVMVSEWMENGNVTDFLKTNGEADRLELLQDVTRGLIYMHGQGVIHGDLKGANILINHEGRACLSDFSLLTIVSDESGAITSCREGGTYPWMSPELLDPPSFGLEKGHPTKESDCYALGMVIYEVLSGKTPFAPLQIPMIMKKVLDRVRPERPQGNEGALFTEGIWGILARCWAHEPAERINAEKVLLGLGGDLSSVSTSSVAVCGDTTIDVYGHWDAASNYSSDNESKPADDIPQGE